MFFSGIFCNFIQYVIASDFTTQLKRLNYRVPQHKILYTTDINAFNIGIKYIDV